MSTVEDILARKGSEVFKVDSNSTVFDAVKSMVNRGIGSLVVTASNNRTGYSGNNGGQVCGIVTERDYLKKTALLGRFSKKTKVCDIMTSELITVEPRTTVDFCIALMTENRIRRLPVKLGGELVGLITIDDLIRKVSRDQKVIVKYLSEQVAGDDSDGKDGSTASTGRVADILERKGHKVYTIEPTSLVFDAIKKMVNNNIGSLLVSSDSTIRGIVTERDYLHGVVVDGRSSKTSQVHEIMTSDLVCVTPEHSVEECMETMSDNRFRRLPVLDNDELVGVITVGDLIKQVSLKQKERIRKLTDKISKK